MKNHQSIVQNVEQLGENDKPFCYFLDLLHKDIKPKQTNGCLGIYSECGMVGAVVFGLLIAFMLWTKI